MALDRPGQPFGASNAWVISGRHTASGKPILANDPHLGFTLPAPWYLARIVTPQGELAGATAPGFPALVLGHNAQIAWGITGSDIDVEDVFIERIDPDAPDRYLAPEGTHAIPDAPGSHWRKGADAVHLTVRATRHGPVISDLTGLFAPAPCGGAGPRQVLALAATYLGDVDGTADALVNLNRARQLGGVSAAAEEAAAPQQNVFYADVSGHIGFVSAGHIPLRPSGGGRNAGAGLDGGRGLVRVRSVRRPAKAFDPPAGHLANANNRPVPQNYPWPIRGAWDDGFRAGG